MASKNKVHKFLFNHYLDLLNVLVIYPNENVERATSTRYNSIEALLWYKFKFDKNALDKPAQL